MRWNTSTAPGTPPMNPLMSPCMCSWHSRIPLTSEAARRANSGRSVVCAKATYALSACPAIWPSSPVDSQFGYGSVGAPVWSAIGRPASRRIGASRRSISKDSRYDPAADWAASYRPEWMRTAEGSNASKTGAGAATGSRPSADDATLMAAAFLINMVGLIPVGPPTTTARLAARRAERKGEGKNMDTRMRSLHAGHGNALNEPLLHEEEHDDQRQC